MPKSQLRKPIRPALKSGAVSNLAGVFYPVAGALVLVLIVYVSFRWSQTPATTRNNTTTLRVTQAGREAFGTLDMSAIRRSTDSASPDTTKDIPPSDDYVYPIFEFTGQLNLPTAPVMRRDLNLDGNFSRLADAVQTSALQLSSFRDLSVNQMTLTEAGSTGYAISFDRTNAQVNIYRNSPDGDVKVMAEPTAQAYEKIPDETLVATANAFLSDHGLSRTGLGTPIVRTDWYVPMAGAREDRASSELYYPSDVTVVYPWKINGVQAYDDGGQAYGLSVSVRVPENKVSGVTNITALSFASSTYKTVTDPEKIKPFIRRGGLYGVDAPAGAKTKTYQLGTPTTGYMVSRYQLDQTNREYLIPALVFPVRTEDQATAGRMSVIVPLVEELLESAGSGGVPVEVPPASSGSGSGSGASTIEPAILPD